MEVWGEHSETALGPLVEFAKLTARWAPKRGITMVECSNSLAVKLPVQTL
jgi:hypothetical protein